jgi:hypothetical protein
LMLCWSRTQRCNLGSGWIFSASVGKAPGDMALTGLPPDPPRARGSSKADDSSLGRDIVKQVREAVKKVIEATFMTRPVGPLMCGYARRAHKSTLFRSTASTRPSFTSVISSRRLWVDAPPCVVPGARCSQTPRATRSLGHLHHDVSIGDVVSKASIGHRRARLSATCSALQFHVSTRLRWRGSAGRKHMAPPGPHRRR